MALKPAAQMLAQRQLDRQLAPLRDLKFRRPPRGWIRAIRDALGMTSGQLGKRLGVSGPRVIAMERGEVNESLTLASLKRAADALECELVYAFVPRKPLGTIALERAKAKILRRIEAANHTMALEDQRVTDPREREAQLLQRAEALLKDNRNLWDEP